MANLYETRENSLTPMELPTIAGKLDGIADDVKAVRNHVERATVGLAATSERMRTGGVRSSSVASLPRYHNSYYNLFVLDDNAYEQGEFYIAAQYALTKEADVDPHITKHFSDLFDNPDTFAEIKTLPSLFMSKNTSHKRTEKSKSAHYGVVDNIVNEDTRIKVFWTKLKAIQQQTLNEAAKELGISATTARNELDSPRWSIKQFDLIPALEGVGIPVEYSVEESNVVLNEGVLV